MQFLLTEEFHIVLRQEILVSCSTCIIEIRVHAYDTEGRSTERGRDGKREMDIVLSCDKQY